MEQQAGSLSESPLGMLCKEAVYVTTELDKDCTILITGEKGTHKTSCLLFMLKYICQIHPKVKKKWEDLEFLGYGKEDSYKLIRGLKKFEFAGIDEAAYVLDIQQWNTKEARDMRTIISTGRKNNNIIFWIIPKLSNLAKALKDVDNIDYIIDFWKPQNYKIYDKKLINKYIKLGRGGKQLPDYISDVFSSDVQGSIPAFYLLHPDVYAKYRARSEEAFYKFKNTDQGINYKDMLTPNEVCGILGIARKTLKLYSTIGFNGRVLTYIINPLNDRAFYNPKEVMEFKEAAMNQGKQDNQVPSAPLNGISTSFSNVEVEK